MRKPTLSSEFPSSGDLSKTLCHKAPLHPKRGTVLSHGMASSGFRSYNEPARPKKPQCGRRHRMDDDMTKTVRIIPLGGLGEIGKNMMLFEYDRNILIVDAGIMFPEHDMWGIDVVIPDFAYLKSRAADVAGIVITHGHEDHIGALPYLLGSVLPVEYAHLRHTAGVRPDRGAPVGASPPARRACCIG